MDTCTPVCLSSPGCSAFPAWSPYSLSPSHTPTQAHIGRVDEEGAGVSASSCVTRLISPQPGRLGPEGSGGGGAGLHSPSDKYVFGAAVLKGHGGRRRRGGLHCAALLGPSQARHGLCDPLQRDDEMQGDGPSSALARPTHSHVQKEMPSWTHRYSNSGAGTYEPTPADIRTGSNGCTKMASWRAGSPRTDPALLPHPNLHSNAKKTNRNKRRRAHSISQRERALCTDMRVHTWTHRVQGRA